MAPGEHCHYQSELAWLLVSTVITRVNWHGSWWALSLWGSTGMDRTSQHHNPRLMDAHTPTTMSTQTSGGTHTPLDTNAQRHSHLNWSLPAGRGWHSSSGGRCRCRHSDPAQSASCTTNTACIRHSVHLTTSHSTPLLIHQTTSHSTPLLTHQTTSTSHSTPLLTHQTTSTPTAHHFSSIKPPPPPTAHHFSPIKPPPPPTAHHFSPIKPPPPPTAHHFSPIKPPPPPTTSHPSNHTYFLQHTPSHPSNHLHLPPLPIHQTTPTSYSTLLLIYQ